VTFTPLSLNGAYRIDPERREDERGFFATTWCAREFGVHGLSTCAVQCNISFNAKRGTLRGMHYQIAPYEQAKLVRCTAGAIYDVLLDLRPASPTYKQWVAAELTADNRRMVYVPEGFAHGFQALTDGAEVFYQMSQFYDADAGRGVRWNDVAFRIVWPIDPPVVIAARDAACPDFQK
jgi:dTDP-4-dehydrorhamnose 3,5-epimerase